MTTVFDIARELITRGGGSLETLKLQKLTFYTFGWYAHLTGEQLFGEKFYAMQRGPVVGELLSAHARQKAADITMIDAQREAREDLPEELDAYTSAVLDGVWRAYGHKDSWDLVNLTHQEAVWVDAWAARPEGSGRGDLRSPHIVEYFLTRAPKPGEDLDLPPAMVSLVSAEDLEAVESSARVHVPFVQAARSLPSR